MRAGGPRIPGDFPKLKWQSPSTLGRPGISPVLQEVRELPARESFLGQARGRGEKRGKEEAEDKRKGREKGGKGKDRRREELWNERAEAGGEEARSRHLCVDVYGA